MSTFQERGAEYGAYGGAAATTLMFGLSVAEWAVIASAVFAGLSFCVHCYFSWKKDRREERRAAREEEKHDVAMADELLQQAADKAKNDKPD